MITGERVNPIARMGNSGILSGLLSTVLGGLVLGWPGISIVVAAALFGAYLLVSGIAQVIAAFGLPITSAAGRVLSFVSGALSLILAVLCFRDVSESIVLLAIWIGIGFVFRGVTAIAMALSDETAQGRGWLGVSGAVNVLAGFVMLGYPFASLQVMVLVAGVWLIVLGVTEIVAGIRLRKHG